MSEVRLIDANALKRDFAEFCASECPICSFYIPNANVDDCHCGLIDRAPTVESPTGKECELMKRAFFNAVETSNLIEKLIQEKKE